MFKLSSFLVLVSLLSACQPGLDSVPEALETSSLDWSEASLPHPAQVAQPVRETTDLHEAVVKIQFEDSDVEGSGFIVHPHGYILTNMHVIKNQNTPLVSFDKGNERYRAKILSRNQCDDLALLKLDSSDGTDYPYLATHRREFGLGDRVTLLGFPLGTKDITLSQGVVSKTRDQHVQSQTGLEHVFETDGFLGSGSSGGPVVNENLEVVGVSVAFTQDKQSVIPWSTVAESLPQMLQNPFVHGWGFLADTQDGEYVVREVVGGSPADKLGLRPADEILEVEGVALAEQPAQQFCRTVRESHLRDTPEVQVERSGYLLIGQLGRRPLRYIRELSARLFP